MKRNLTLMALLVSATPMLVAQVPLNLYGRAANGTRGVVAALSIAVKNTSPFVHLLFRSFST